MQTHQLNSLELLVEADDSVGLSNKGLSPQEFLWALPSPKPPREDNYRDSFADADARAPLPL